EPDQWPSRALIALEVAGNRIVLDHLAGSRLPHEPAFVLFDEKDLVRDNRLLAALIGTDEVGDRARRDARQCSRQRPDRQYRQRRALVGELLSQSPQLGKRALLVLLGELAFEIDQGLAQVPFPL